MITTHTQKTPPFKIENHTKPVALIKSPTGIVQSPTKHQQNRPFALDLLIPASPSSKRNRQSLIPNRQSNIPTFKKLRAISPIINSPTNMGVEPTKKRTTTTTTSPYNTRAEKAEKDKKQQENQKTPEKNKKIMEKEKLADGFCEEFQNNFDLAQPQINCTTCKQTGTMIIAQDTNAMYTPPAPMLHCNNCSGHFTHKHFLEIIVQVSTILKKHQAATPISQPDDMDLFIHNFPQLPDYLQAIHKRLDKHDEMFAELVKLQEKVNELTDANNSLEQKNKKLEHELATLRDTEKINPSTGSQASKYAGDSNSTNNNSNNNNDTQNKNASSSSASTTTKSLTPSYAQITTRKVNNKKPTTRQVQAAARKLAPSTQSGFKFVYLHQHHRMTIKQLRDTLRKLKIDNSRILDVHFPDRGVVGILIHNDYESDLTAQLNRRGVQLHKAFDPCHPDIVRDPEFKDKSTDERTTQAKIIFNNTCNRAINFIKTPHIKIAIARNFLQKEWISENDFQSYLAPEKTNDEAALAAANALRPNSQTPPPPESIDMDDDMGITTTNDITTAEQI